MIYIYHSDCWYNRRRRIKLMNTILSFSFTKIEVMGRRLLIFISLFFALHVHAINVVFRLDDPTLQADSVSLRAVKLFNKKQVPLSIAIVSFDEQEQPILPLIAADSLYLSELRGGNIELTLHGLTHEDINGKGEFGGLNYSEAQRRIRMGMDVLKSAVSQDIVTFIPPFNAFNDSTLVAMKDNGLFILSADMHSNIYRDGIQYYPETLGHLMKQKGIWHATEDAIFGCNQKDAICVVMFHAYDLPDEASWQRLEKLLDACKVDKNIELHTFRSLYDSGNLSTQYRYRANQLHSLLQKHLLHPGVLHTTWLCWLVHISNALMYALLPLLALLLGWCMFKRKKMTLTKPVLVVGVLLSVAFFMLPILQISAPMKVLMLDVVVSSCLLGWMLVIAK